MELTNTSDAEVVAEEVPQPFDDLKITETLDALNFVFRSRGGVQ
jgi:hypothetical protein